MKDFFDHQRDAIVRARWALAGFCLTLLLVMGSTAILVAFLLTEIGYWKDIPAWTEARNTAPLAAGLTFLILSMFCMLRALKLRKGIARQLRDMGGSLIAADTPVPAYRQVYNLVEEMAIASGLPVPDIYLLDEEGVNACAFGLNPKTTAIGITRGAVNRLPRDELQAVVAHEFSHILYGDFLLNTRLLVGLAGLFGVARIGYLLIFSSVGPQKGPTRFGGLGFRTLPLFLLGWGFILTGSIGTFFGKLLQAAVSRHREFLADASAMQFTRNPPAVARALKALGTASFRGHVRNPAFIECAHMMFANAQVLWITGLFSTHPPLEKRIRRIEPDWDGSFPSLGRNPLLPTGHSSPPPAPPPKNRHRPTAETLYAVHLWLEETPNPLLDLLHSPAGAAAFVLHILLSADPEIRNRQHDIIHREAPSEIRARLNTLQNDFPHIASKDRFPLLDLCAPGLRNLQDAEKAACHGLALKLTEADQRISLFEYAVRCHLDRILLPGNPQPLLGKQSCPLKQNTPECILLISILARMDVQSEAEAREVFQRAMKDLPETFHSAEIQLQEHCTLKGLDAACRALARLNPDAKRQLLRACRAAVYANGILQEDEEMAYRAIASVFNVPVPPDFRSA
ncbi:MAG: M48 family metalloprotease [Verrucomicrobia bacterium]|nr:M48 family metalloprotease [Verrucomicrobiota bacterium]MCH8528958.1 M48 family metalloprotease [Kiritimatiellia bacterium]